jgi:fused signal recognition particle receptor
MKEYLLVALALLGVLILGGLSLVVPRLRRRPEPPLPETEVDTRAEEDLAGPPVEAAESDLRTGVLVEPPVVEAPPLPTIEVPEPTAGRLVRLRSRLSRSQNVFGKGLLGLLSRDRLDEDTWEEIEDSLITADVGIDSTREIVDRLRERTRVLGTTSCAPCSPPSWSTRSTPRWTGR